MANTLMTSGEKLFSTPDDPDDDDAPMMSRSLSDAIEGKGAEFALRQMIVGRSLDSFGKRQQYSVHFHEFWEQHAQEGNPIPS